MRRVGVFLVLVLMGCSAGNPEPGSFACETNGALIYLDSAATEGCKYTREDSIRLNIPNGYWRASGCGRALVC